MGKVILMGDLHGIEEFPKINKIDDSNLNKEDFLIILGDFGLVWDNNWLEKTFLNILNKKNFTTLFVHGNHENFNLLNKMPIIDSDIGKVRKVKDNIFQLLNGHVYHINNNNYFVMGGAVSIDKHLRIKNINWWPEEEPSQEDYNIALNNLEKYNWTVDYVITHTASTEILLNMGFQEDRSEINRFFSFLDQHLKFKKWFFGHLHDDIEFQKYHLLYNDIVYL